MRLAHPGEACYRPKAAEQTGGLSNTKSHPGKSPWGLPTVLQNPICVLSGVMDV